MKHVKSLHEKPTVFIRVFLAGMFAFILYSFFNKYFDTFLENSLALPLFLSQTLLFGFLVLLFDFILKEIGL